MLVHWCGVWVMIIQNPNILEIYPYVLKHFLCLETFFCHGGAGGTNSNVGRGGVRECDTIGSCGI